MVTMITGGDGLAYNHDIFDIQNIFTILRDVTSLNGATGITALDSSQNYTQFSGTGFVSTGAPGQLTSISAGVIQSIIVVRQGFVVLQITGAEISASDFFLACSAPNFNQFEIALGGNDTITGTSFNDELIGFDGNDIVNGGDGNDRMFGGNGNDVLNGGNGENYFAGDVGTDSYNGGIGTTANDYDVVGYGADALVFNNISNGIVSISVVMNTTGVIGSGVITGTVISGAVNANFTHIERIIGSVGNDSFLANTGFITSSHSDFNWIGGDGNDYFSNTSAASIAVNYDAEKFENYGVGNYNNIWGDAAGEFGVIVNRSGSNIIVNVGDGNKTVLAGTALDTFRNIDTLSGLLGFKLTDTSDYYVAGSGDNLFVEARGGNDTLIGGTGNDEFDGGDGIDTITAGAGDDYLNGGAGNDILNGGDGENFYEGGSGKDSYIGGVASATNYDKLSYERETGGAGIVVTFGLNGNVGIIDTFGNNETGSNIEAIKGSQYADTFNGSTGNDKAEGMGGNDTFNMGSGFDQVKYTNEVDAGATLGVILNMSAVTISANIGGGLFSVLAGKARDSFGNTDTLISVERVDGTNFIDYMVGSGLVDELNGNGGNDTLFGGAGGDYLNGGSGSDSLYGGAGADDFDGGDNDGVGIDYARYDDANHGNLTIRLDAPASNTGAAAADTYVGIEGLVGGIGNDTIVGNVSANYLFGGSGVDGIYGLGGADYLNGGAGEDNLWGGAGADQHIGGDDAGVDHARYDDANHGNLTIRLDAPAANVGAVAVGDTYTGIEGLVGGLGNDTVVGNVSVNYLFGGGGNDNVYGQGGADYLSGGEGTNNLWGGSSADQHIGGTGIDYARYDDANWGNLIIRLDAPFANSGAVAVGDTYTGIEGLVGGLGNDVIIGNASNNYLFGGGFNDYIDGRAGNDYLNGGAGADRFVFNLAFGATNMDTIADFVHLTDDIVLSQAIFAGIGATLDASEFQIGVANASTDRIVYNNITGQLFYDSNGNVAGGIIQFMKVTAGTVLDINDFVMV